MIDLTILQLTCDECGGQFPMFKTVVEQAPPAAQWYCLSCMINLEDGSYEDELPEMTLKIQYPEDRLKHDFRVEGF